MIHDKTARRLMYEWHGGQFSALYRAASSGLVQDWEDLLRDCYCMKNDQDNPKDYEKLTEWINKKRSMQKSSVIVQGVSYATLPWAGDAHTLS